MPSAERPTLYGFAISHYSEKARWAMDLSGIDYDSVDLLPGPHRRVVRRATGRGTTVPLLVHGSTVVHGSGAILDHLEQHHDLPAANPAHAHLAPLLDRAFGIALRQVAYHAYLGRRDLLIPLWAQGASARAALGYRLTFPIFDRILRKEYDVSDRTCAAAMDTVRDAVTRIDAELGQRLYLDGERFGRLDLELAALFGPLVRPPNHICRWPAQAPGLLSALEDELRASRTFEHVARMYREHRYPKQGMLTP